MGDIDMEYGGAWSPAPSVAGDFGDPFYASDTPMTDESSAGFSAAISRLASARAATASKAAGKPRAPRVGRKINDPPTEIIDVLVCGRGLYGELGMGVKKAANKMPANVKRPRLNHLLKAKKTGVVQVACGGRHGVALTADNRILTWGENALGALGRSTPWEVPDDEHEPGNAKDGDDGSVVGIKDDLSEVNPKRAEPGEIDTKDVGQGTTWVQVVATDSATFALTADGRVYAWGTFCRVEGILGFTEDCNIQRTPVILDQPRGVTQLSAGRHHVLALDGKQKVCSWGCGYQDQLGRKAFERDPRRTLRANAMGYLPLIKQVACGSDHSFAIDRIGRVHAWGLNSYGQLGTYDPNDDAENNTVLKPIEIKALAEHKIVDIAGGDYHSIACTADGKLLTWGRLDGFQAGLAPELLNNKKTVYGGDGKAYIAIEPIVIPDVTDVASVSAAGDHSMVVTKAGEVYSWGTGLHFQMGQGRMVQVPVPTVIGNAATKKRKIMVACAGTEFSILGAAPKE